MSGNIIKCPDFEGITPFLYYIRVPAERRDEFREYMISNGVDIGIHWQPGHWFKLFQNVRRGDLSVTDKIGHEIVSLPLHSCMEEGDIDTIVLRIKEFFNHAN